MTGNKKEFYLHAAFAASFVLRPYLVRIVFADTPQVLPALLPIMQTTVSSVEN
jgi:hypothetical protein